MKIHTKAVHSGDRKAGLRSIPVTTPIHLAASFFYQETDQLDRVFSKEDKGFAYARYGNPTNAALEELMAALEGGAGALACASGMAAMQIALTSALLDRRKCVLAASAMYGANVSLLTKVFEPFGTDIHFVDICDLGAVERLIAEIKPGCMLMETVSNPLLRVGALDQIAKFSRATGVPLIVDNTFATPLMIRPLELGADIVVHSATKYLNGHGDVLGGIVIATEEHLESIQALSRVYGPVMGPFEAYLTMRGIKTFPLRFERQCENAARVAAWLASNERVAAVHHLSDPAHPDAHTICRLFPQGLYGAMISFELKNAGRDEVFRWMERLKMVVPATSLGDVHSMVLYPAMSSHREIAPKQRERMGIADNLIRLSIGIEAPEDILEDLEQAFG